MDLTTLPDCDLVEQCLGNNPEAFEVLYGRHKDDIRKFLISREFNSPVDIDDILQITWYRVFENLSSYDPNRSLRTWLCHIAKTEARRLHETQSSQKRGGNGLVKISSFESIPDIIDTLVKDKRTGRFGVDPLETIMLREELQLIYADIDRLKEDDQQAIRYICIENLTYQEASIIMGIPVQTVHTRVSRARTKLTNKCKIRSGESLWGDPVAVS